MRLLEVFVIAIVVAATSCSPILEWGKQDGNSLLEKVSNLKQTVYEKKREFINGINEKVSRALWIPPWPSTTTEETPYVVPAQQDPVSERPSVWWWQTKSTTPEAVTSTTTEVETEAPRASTDTVRYEASARVPTIKPLSTGQLDNDRLVFTVADTNDLELPIVSMYARSNFIPEELRLTDSVEYTGPIFGRGPPVPASDPERLIVL